MPAEPAVESRSPCPSESQSDCAMISAAKRAASCVAKPGSGMFTCSIRVEPVRWPPAVSVGADHILDVAVVQCADRLQRVGLEHLGPLSHAAEQTVCDPGRCGSSRTQERPDPRGDGQSPRAHRSPVRVHQRCRIALTRAVCRRQNDSSWMWCAATSACSRPAVIPGSGQRREGADRLGKIQARRGLEPREAGQQVARRPHGIVSQRLERQHVCCLCRGSQAALVKAPRVCAAAPAERICLGDCRGEPRNKRGHSSAPSSSACSAMMAVGSASWNSALVPASAETATSASDRQHPGLVGMPKHRVEQDPEGGLPVVHVLIPGVDAEVLLEKTVAAVRVCRWQTKRERSVPSWRGIASRPPMALEVSSGGARPAARMSGAPDCHAGTANSLASTPRRWLPARVAAVAATAASIGAREAASTRSISR